MKKNYKILFGITAILLCLSTPITLSSQMSVNQEHNYSTSISYLTLKTSVPIPINVVPDPDGN